MNFNQVAKLLDTLLPESNASAPPMDSVFLDRESTSISRLISKIHRFLSTAEAMGNLGAIKLVFTGAFVIIAIVGIFAYLFYSSYITAITSRFISLDYSSGDCSYVYRPFSGTFYLSLDGDWSGSKEFQQYKAVYQLDMTNIGADYDQFIAAVTNEVKLLTLKAPEIPAQQTMLYWSFFEYKWSSNANAQQFRFLGDLPTMIAPIGSQCLVWYCSTEVLTCDFDPTTAVGSFPVDVSERCSEELTPFHYQMGDMATVDLDAVSIAAAVAVNLGILNFEYLIPVATTFPMPYGESTYDMQWMVYPRYPNMRPIVCVVGVDKPIDSVDEVLMHKCFYLISFGTGQSFTYAVPVVDHTGYDFFTEKYHRCICSPKSPNDYCSNFNIMFTIAFDGRMRYPDGGPQYNSLYYAFNLLLETETQEQLFSLVYDCTLYGPCNRSDYLIFASMILYAHQRTASAYSNFEIPDPACSDTFYYPGALNDQLVQPVPPFESYFDCLPHKPDSLYSAFGLASGTLQIIMLPLMFTVLTMLYCAFRITGDLRPFHGFTEDDKSLALDELANALLAAHHNMQNGSDAKPPRGALLRQLVEELQQVAREQQAMSCNSVAANKTTKGDATNIDVGALKVSAVAPAPFVDCE